MIKGFYSLLANNPDLNALIGGTVVEGVVQQTGRIYPFRRKQGSVLPGITYMSQQLPPDICKGGNNSSRSYLVSVEVYSQLLSEIEAICGIIESVLNGYSGVSAGVNIRNIQSAGHIDIYDDEAECPGRSLEFFLYV